jgi:broad specificity phosphatase PhoE
MARIAQRVRLLERRTTARPSAWPVATLFEQNQGETLAEFEARVEREAAELERQKRRRVMPVLFVYDDGTPEKYEEVVVNGIITFREKGLGQ